MGEGSFCILFFEKTVEVYNRIKGEGVVWSFKKISKILRDTIFPPWNHLYWLPLKEAMSSVRGSQAEELQYGAGRFNGALLELRVITNLSQLSDEEYQALTESVGHSDIPVYEQRFAKGVELHVLFIDKKVAGTISFVFGETHLFQHVVLTKHDAMALDGRIDPKYRGQGLYPTLLSLSIKSLIQRGVERLFIDTDENNEAANRSYSSVGFQFLLRYKLKSGGYYFDQKAI